MIKVVAMRLNSNTHPQFYISQNVSRETFYEI